MHVMNRTKLIEIASEAGCNEIDMLRVLKMSNPEILIVVLDDTDKFPYSFQLIKQLKQELGFEYKAKNVVCMA